MQVGRLGLGMCAAVAALAVAGSGQAKTVDWTINGTFDDGGTFGGTFAFDTLKDSITSYDVSTSGDGNLGEHYWGFIFQSAWDNGSGPSFADSFIFDSIEFDLTNIPLGAGGVINGLTGDENYSCSFFCSSQSRNVTGGTAVGVALAGAAEPGTWALMTLGVGLAGGVLRRRRLRAA